MTGITTDTRSTTPHESWTTYPWSTTWNSNTTPAPGMQSEVIDLNDPSIYCDSSQYDSIYARAGATGGSYVNPFAYICGGTGSLEEKKNRVCPNFQD